MDNDCFVFYLYEHVHKHIRRYKIPVSFDSNDKARDYALCLALFKDPVSFDTFIDSQNVEHYLRFRHFLATNSYPLININHVKLQYKLKR